jgi:ribokinase
MSDLLVVGDANPDLILRGDVVPRFGQAEQLLTLPGAIGALRPDDIELTGVRHAHVASYFLQPALASGLADVFRRARKAGITTSLDTNWDPAGRWDGVRDVLAYTDVFLPNRDTAAETLTALGVIVVLKDSAAGARAWQPGGSCRVPGLAVEVVDTTGAGTASTPDFLPDSSAVRHCGDVLRWLLPPDRCRPVRRAAPRPRPTALNWRRPWSNCQRR